MENLQKLNMYSSDFARHGNEYKNSAYLQDPKSIGKVSKRNSGGKYKNGKVMNRRLRSGQSNNRPNLNVYSSGSTFVDPIYSNQRRKVQNRGKSLKTKGRQKEKPYTAQNQKRKSYLNEKQSDGNIKESYVSNLKQTIEDEQTREDNNASMVSELAVAKGPLPSVDHELSKRKIDDLMFKPYSEDPEVASKNISIKSRDKNGPETNLNDMPDLTTFDNRTATEYNKLISKKTRGRGKPMPNQSMRNLNKEEEVLPIYKRRAYNKGPIKIGEKSYMKRPLKTHYSSKRQNNWIQEQMNMSGDENMNHLNHNQPVKAKANRTGRQQSDFRINRNKSKNRGKTAQGPRNQTRSTLAASNPSGYKKPSATLQAKDNIQNSRTRKPNFASKRAFSQNNERIKKSSGKKKKSKRDEFKDLNDRQGDLGATSPPRKEASKPKEQKDFIEKALEKGDDVEAMIKMAEAKIKATADAMIHIQMADQQLDQKIESLNDFETSHDRFQNEDDNIQDHLEHKNTEGMTRQEKIANIVDTLVAKNADLDIPENYSESADSKEEIQEIENQNTLMAFTDKGLDSIKEQVTEEIHATSVNESVEINTKKEDEQISRIFETHKKVIQENSVEETPGFGQKDPFASFLCSNEISTAKKEDIVMERGAEMQIFEEEEISKNILPEFGQEYDIERLIKLQSLFRQILAQRKLKELRQRKYISDQQRGLSSNKRKILALRVISRLWILYKEAKVSSENWKYLDENNKDWTEEPYHYHCDTFEDLKYIETQFRKRVFKKVREYLKSIPQEWRQSYVKLIDCKIYQREMKNRLKVMQKVSEAKRKQQGIY